jgi:hypothetical protein
VHLVAAVRSLNNLVSASQQCLWDGEAKGFGGLEVHGYFEFDRQPLSQFPSDRNSMSLTLCFNSSNTATLRFEERVAIDRRLDALGAAIEKLHAERVF